MSLQQVPPMQPVVTDEPVGQIRVLPPIAVSYVNANPAKLIDQLERAEIA